MRAVNKELLKTSDPKLIKEQKLLVNVKIPAFDYAEVELKEEEDITTKFINSIERQIRNSFEYRRYIKYLKDELELTSCSLLPNLDIKEINFGLEFHHYPFTLYDLVEIVAKQMVNNLPEGRESISDFEIAERVTLEHYRNIVGLIPITKTVHQMAHSGSIFIPMSKINGNYKLFIEEYKEYIDPMLLQKIEAAEKYNESPEAINHNNEKLEKRVLNYEIEYEENPII